MDNFLNHRHSPILDAAPWEGHLAERFSVLPTNHGRILCFGETTHLLFDVSGKGMAMGSDVPRGHWHQESQNVTIAESLVSACLQIIPTPNQSGTLVYFLPHQGLDRAGIGGIP